MEEEFDYQHRKENHYDSSSHHSRKNPTKDAIFARLALLLCIVPHQQNGKVGKVIGSTTKKVLFFGSGTVGPFYFHTGEALVFALPFSSIERAARS